MSEDLNRGACDFSQYDTMTTEALEEILRLDSEVPEGQESDTERLLYIMEVLAQRDRQLQTPGKTALQAWESFQQDYLNAQDADEEGAFVPVRSAHPRRFRLIAAAAVIAILIAVPVAVHAFDWEEIWNAVAKWTKETFSFVNGGQEERGEPTPNDTNQYASLQDALEATDQDSDFVPTWIPEGYALNDISISETPGRKSYVALYRKGDKDLSIMAQAYLDSDPENVEIDGELVEIYKVKGKEYHILSNNQRFCAVWLDDSYECGIFGDLTIEQIKTMIDSIGKE